MEENNLMIDDLFKAWEDYSNKIRSELDRQESDLLKKQKELNELEMFSKYDNSLIKDFIKEPYVIIPRKEGEWFLIIPKFFDLNVGYLTKSTNSYNVFIVNKYADYLGGVPEGFKKLFKFKKKMDLKIFDGVLLTGNSNQDRAWSEYNKFLTRREGKDKIKIKER